MDLSTLYASKHTVITLKHPVTGATLYCDEEEKDPATWSLLSKHTSEYKKIAMQFARDVKAEFGTKKLSELSDEETDKMDELTTQLTIDSTVGFNIFLDGKKPKFTKAKAADILTDEQLFWLKQQVVIGANEAENFIQA